MQQNVEGCKPPLDIRTMSTQDIAMRDLILGMAEKGLDSGYISLFRDVIFLDNLWIQSTAIKTVATMIITIGNLQLVSATYYQQSEVQESESAGSIDLNIAILRVSVSASLNGEQQRRISQMCNLIVLHLEFGVFTDEEAITILLALPQLEDVSFRGCHRLTDGITQTLASLDYLSRLDLGHCSALTPIGYCVLTNGSRCIQVLDLSSSRVTTKEFNALGGQLPHLKILRLTQCQELKVAHIYDWNFPSLEELYLSSCNSLESVVADGDGSTAPDSQFPDTITHGAPSPLRIIDLSQCQKLKSVYVCDMAKLIALQLDHSIELQTIILVNLIALKELDLSTQSNCIKIAIDNVPQLKDLYYSYKISPENIKKITGKNTKNIFRLVAR